eukprot:TRINITY_DN61110_c0_g1_i1.p1 TRINITY_DN61110_c0_g1~~TRINITY_DN61110_c0_g1_i1.p1  ORF type:complete len:361 (+),score=64.43 TRINITY_DN61110_c0_g1_i1:66-1085(+)
MAPAGAQLAAAVLAGALGGYIARGGGLRPARGSQLRAPLQVTPLQAAPASADRQSVSPRYAELAADSWGRRAWRLPEAERLRAAGARSALRGRISREVRGEYMASAGDFEAHWHLGLLAPRNATIVELGAAWGMSSVVIASAIVAAGSGARLFTYDLWETFPLRGDANVAQYRQRMRDWGIPDSIATPHRSRSDAAAARFADSSVDAVLIDADHSFYQLLADISAWWPKLRPDGLMLGHDAFTHSGYAPLTTGFSASQGWMRPYVMSDMDFGHAALMISSQCQRRGCREGADVQLKEVQGIQVSMAAIRFAQDPSHGPSAPAFVCCLPNSSVWHYRRPR